MTSLILGTAGHIDHGKTALVRALTGVDTDRLQEEKERGITIELGFAELLVNSDLRFGVVDVPGHEAFVRAMVAGAAGMDIVLLVVAADEGVMPQTREHLAIIELLDVPELLVAITKVDMVDEEWLELVDADIQALLEGTRYRSAGRLPTSAKEEIGLAPLIDALKEAAERVRSRDKGDLVRLPLDRVFTIQGAGTVVTGTLWTGTLRDGDRVKILRSWGDCYGHFLVAIGQAEVMLDPVLSRWDIVPIKPVVEEAGGIFTDWQGNPLNLLAGRQVLATANPALHEQALARLDPAAAS